MIDKCCGMYFINFSFTIWHEEECSCRQNEAIRPTVDVQKNINVATKADGKSARLLEKSCATRTFCSRLASWDTQYRYEISERVVQTVLINSNYWKQLISTFTWLFLWGHDEKWALSQSRLMEKKWKFCTNGTFWGLGVILQVSNINGKLKESVF